MLVPGNLKLVIIHRDKPRTGSLERVARSRDALQGRQPVRKRKGEGLVVSRYRASCMEITGIPAGPLSLSLSISPSRGSGRHNDLRFEIKSRLYNPPLLLPPLLPLFSISSLPERVFESINLGNRFSSRFASRRKKRKTRREKRILVAPCATRTKSFSSENFFSSSFSFRFNERESISISLVDDNSVDGTGGISTYLSGPICKFN